MPSTLCIARLCRGDGVDEADEQEKHEQRGRRVVVVRQQAALDNHVCVGQRHADEQSKYPPTEDGAQTYAALVFPIPD